MSDAQQCVTCHVNVLHGLFRITLDHDGERGAYTVPLDVPLRKLPFTALHPMFPRGRIQSHLNIIGRVTRFRL